MKRVVFLASLMVVLMIITGTFWGGTASAFRLSIEVASDKELYSIGETAHFTVVIHRGGRLVRDKHLIIESTFPDESTPVSLTRVSRGVFSYHTPLSLVGEQTLTVSVNHHYFGAIAAMEAKISRLEQEVAELQGQLAEETNPKKRRILQTKIDNRVAMIVKFEDKIANMEEPKAVGMKTITVECGGMITLWWMNMMNGRMADGLHCVNDTFREAKLSMLSALDIPVEDADLYMVSTAPYGTPFDESKTVAELGLSDGAMLYVWRD